MQEVRGSIPRSSTKFLLQEEKGHRYAVAFLFVQAFVFFMITTQYLQIK